MLSQVIAKARSRDEKLKAAKEKAVELKHGLGYKLKTRT